MTQAISTRLSGTEILPPDTPRFAPPISPAELTPKRLWPEDAPTPPANSLPPAITLSTGRTAPLPNIDGTTNAISAASDGTIWMLILDGAGGTLQIYDYATAAPKQIYASPDAIITAICAVSVNQVYIVATGNTSWIGYVDGSGTRTEIGSLPGGGATVADVAAAPDGTVWALDSNGNPYRYANDVWTIQNESGQKTLVFTTISVGGADLIVAAATLDGLGPLFWQWSEESGWQSFAPGGGDLGGKWIAACADGSVWSLTGTTLSVAAPGNVVKSIDVSSLSTAVGWTAGSQFLCCVVSMAALKVFIVPFTLGILDLPAVSWPAMTADQTTAYTAINTALRITVAGGIRTQYTNTIAPLSSYQVELSQTPQPSDVSAEDWATVKNQIMTELTDVIAVNLLFSNLGTLAGFLATIQSDQLQSVSSSVGLTVQAQGSSEVTLLLNTLVTTFLTRVGSLFPPPYGLAISLVGSSIAAAATYTTQQNSPNAPSGTLQVAYSKLAEVMAQSFVQATTERGNEQTAIVTDWGKLSIAGQAIRQGLWTWPDNLTASMLTALEPVWQLYFYQALMPAAWQILQGEEIFGPSVPTLTSPPKSPNHAMMTKDVTDSDYNQLVWYFICCQLGSSANIVANDGSYPSTVLAQDIFTGLNVVPSDFFGGQNGWSLPVVTSTGWSDPSATVDWNEYNPNDS